MTAFLAKNSDLAGFANNFLFRFSRNIASFFDNLIITFYCKLAYKGMTGFLFKNCADESAFLADKAGFADEIS